jgi:sirohydrochlorin cobaltochelatase
MTISPKSNAALIVVGHGSTENPDSSDPTHRHIAELRRRGLFAEVVPAFWKEDPGMPEVWHMIDSDLVYVVPNFISEGYFTTEVIPRELGLQGRVSKVGRREVRYCDPVGIHPSMTDLLLRRAAEVAPDVPPGETTLLITGHGTNLNTRSRAAIEEQTRIIRETGPGFAEVLDTYMEEAPLIAEWDQLAPTPNVIVVPFFIADGLHSYQDIPVLLGIEEEPGAAASQREVFRHNPHHLRGKNLYYASAIGTEPHLADVILDQVAHFDAHYLHALA